MNHTPLPKGMPGRRALDGMYQVNLRNMAALVAHTSECPSVVVRTYGDGITLDNTKPCVHCQSFAELLHRSQTAYEKAWRQVMD